MRTFFCLFILLLSQRTATLAQPLVAGHIYNGMTKEPVAFATIKFGNSGQGMVAGLDGAYEIPAGFIADHIPWIEVSCLGYMPLKVSFPLKDVNLYLQPSASSLDVVTVTPPYEKMRRILDNAIANKARNNPDKYDWYRCHVYYKMIVDADRQPAKTDTSVILKKKEKGKKKNPTDNDSLEQRKITEFLENQHLLLSETYSIRTWRRPQMLQEDVLASRMSGLKRSMFTSLVTDVLPFHAYTDYINLNGKDYHNPVSRGYEQYYKFNLADELLQGHDTVWIMSFRPRTLNADNLRGTVYINSDGYAISQIIARANDTILKMDVRIEQQYDQLPYAGGGSRWFPRHLNYIIDWQQESSRSTVGLHMKGNSSIDSVAWDEDKDFRFDRTHTVKLRTAADELSDSAWGRLRTEPLNAKEQLTYKVIDSIGEKAHLDKAMTFLAKIPEAKIPVSIFDFDLKRIITINNYESVRLGLGMQTNEHLIKWLSLGGWVGYGFGDAKWKYGAFGELYFDRFHEFVFRAGYTDDINDPGRVHLGYDLDKNYLNSYLLQRVDNTKTYTASLKKKIGYWSLELSGRQQQITPQYAYSLAYDGAHYTTFTATEATLGFRYAYAERTSPYFNYYTSLGSRYPIWYGRITTGTLSGNANLQIPYMQAVTAILWHKHINRLGYEHFLLEGGKSWSNSTLPLSKLFAGNGYEYDTKSTASLYTFGGMMTIPPYQYYSDQFVNFIFRHDFDWKLWRLEAPDVKQSSAPNLCLQYNFLYGSLAHPEAQQFVNFSVPDIGYNEVGLLLNNLLRARAGNLYYLTANIGYFYHLASTPDFGKNGRLVFGLGVEL